MTRVLRRVVLAWGITMASAGCDGPGPRGPLPDLLTAVVSLEQGGYASLAVELPRPGAAPIVRLTPGALALGPGWAEAVILSSETLPGGEVLHVVSWEDLAPRGASARAVLDAEPSLLGLHLGGAWLTLGDQVLWLDARGLAPPRPAIARGAGGRPTREGPGRGFGVRVWDHRLELTLPKMEMDVWAPILHGVGTLLGSWWVTTPDLPAWERTILDGQFKQVAAVIAAQGHAVVDGRLDEWREARAVPVDDASQVVSGADHWSGPRDGSFGVAARREGDRVFLAIRVRDDAMVVGEDRLELTLEGRGIDLPLPAGAATLEGDGWRAVSSEPVDYGIAVEFESTLSGSAEGDLVLPLVVHFVDFDPGEGSTRLGTAAWPTLVPVSHLQPPASEP